MARSSYIYLVKTVCDYDAPGVPLAAFTVKHELITWLKRKTGAELADMELWRLHDGIWQDNKITLLDVDELLS